MNKELTQEDLQNLLKIIAKVSITGAEAMTIAILQQKISNLLTPLPAKAEAKDDKKAK